MRYNVFRLQSVIRNLIPSIPESRGGYSFGEKNDLPNEIIQTITSSGTASACIDRLDTFIQADGFMDEKVGKKKANRAQTFEDLLEDLSTYAPYFPAVAIRVYVNAKGEPTYFENVPAPYLRPTDQGTYIYNCKFGTKNYKRKDDIELKTYMPGSSEALKKQRVAEMREQIQQHGKQVGQLYYIFKKSALENGDLLPIPSYIGGLEDIKSDAALSTLEYSNIKQGWRPKVIITTPPIDDETEDENGYTDKDAFNSTIQSFTGQDGAEVAHIESTNENFEPKVAVLDVAKTLDATEKAVDRIGRKVCRLLNVPPILIGMTTAGKLGDNQELKNYMKLFSLSVSKSQRRITRALKDVTKGNPELEGFDYSLTSLRIFDYIPTELLSKLSKNEIADLYEISLPENTNPGDETN